MPSWEDNVTLVGCGWHLFGDRLILTRVLWLSPNITMFCSTHKNWQDGWTPNAFGGHLIARKQLKKILLGLTSKCLICPNMSGTKPRQNRISREFYQKETINVPVNKQTYLLYSRGCHNPGSVNSRESVGNLDNLSVKIAQAGQSPSTSIISAYSSQTVAFKIANMMDWEILVIACALKNYMMWIYFHNAAIVSGVWGLCQE